MGLSSLRTVIALIAALATLLVLVPFADADPPDDSPPPAGGAVIDSPTLSLADLGENQNVTFYGGPQTFQATLTFPVPPGLAPVALNASLQLPVNLQSGNLTVTQGERTISRIDLPLAGQVPIVIPLVGTEVSDETAAISMVATMIPAGDYCWDRVNPLQLTEGSIAFSGVEQVPATVAAFFPPVLRQLTIALPQRPSQAESNAAVQLAAAVVSKYRGQNIGVLVVSLPAEADTLVNPSSPLERQVVVKEGADAGLSLRGAGVPALRISGQGAELTNQARLLTDSSSSLALGPRVRAGALQYRTILAAGQATLAQLDQPQLVAAALWPQVSIAIDQSRFGRALSGVKIHLQGSYTPVPANFGGAVKVTVGNETIDRWPSEPSGVIDRWVEVPDRLLARVTSVNVTVMTTGYHGQCGDYLPIQLEIGGDTLVQVSPANPPIPAGFQSLPQTLMSRTQVGIGDADTFMDTVRAVQIVAGLQKLSAAALSTNVTTMKQAISGGDPAILISADGWSDKSIRLPINSDKGQISVDANDPDGNPTTLTVDPVVQFGSLQTIFDGKRSLLVATSNGAPGQVDALLQWLSAEPRRWADLDGKAAVLVAGQLPVMVPTESNDGSFGQDAQLTSVRQQQGSAGAWWVAGGVVAIAVAGILAIVMTSRRKDSTRTRL
ncbi:MAG: hypothetical protein KDB72_21795 [Mycobacterium sp.]|nr:hypothetical protein [Mycobacterium sp.]